MACICVYLCVFFQRLWITGASFVHVGTTPLVINALQLVIPTSLVIHYSQGKPGLMDHSLHPFCSTKCGMDTVDAIPLYNEHITKQMNYNCL